MKGPSRDESTELSLGEPIQVSAFVRKVESFFDRLQMKHDGILDILERFRFGASLAEYTHL